MRNRLLWLLPLLGAFLIAGLVYTTSRAQVDYSYCDVTGHSISGEFLAFYSSSSDPVLLYGYPITDDFIDIHGKDVQYFQKGRFEIDPTAPAGNRVKVSNLGSLIFQSNQVTPVLNMPIHTAACARYGDYYVCDAFLDFFKKYGGVEQFGYPLSNYSVESGHFVQYFERARFEYQPEWSSLGYVALTTIGYLQFDISGNDRIHLVPVPIRDQPISLKAAAFIEHAVVRSNDQQVLYVVVVDQLNRSISGANITMVIHQPDGTDLPTSMNPTGDDGVSKFIYDLENLLPNQVYRIDVEVTYQGLKTSASTWYRSWW